MLTYKPLAIAAVVAMNLTACGTVQKVTQDITGSSKKGATDVRFEHAETRSAGVQVKVTGVSDAAEGWLNYKVALNNNGSQAISDLRGIIVDINGNEHKAATDPDMLQSLPSGVDGALLVTAASLGGMALALVGIPLVGPILAGGVMLYELNKVDDWSNTATTFVRESMMGQSVPINDQITGSFYFPAVKPTKVKIGYLKGNTRHWITIDNKQS
jgi:hypothetical protein